MRNLLLIFLISFCFFSISSVYAGNPFQAPCKSDTGKVKKNNPPNPIYIKLAQIQQNLSEKLSGLMKEVKDTGNFLSMIPLILIAFIYGIIQFLHYVIHSVKLTGGFMSNASICRF